MKQPKLNVGYIKQYFGALIVALPGFLFGMTMGWSSPAIFLLTSNGSPLPSGPITMEEASWVTALKPGSMVFGCIIAGMIAKKFGRKLPLISSSIPSLVSWILIYFASNVYYLYVARIIQGFVVAGTLSFGHLYLVEISSDRLRGALTSTLMLSANTGILAAFAIGTYMGYYASPVFAITINIVFAILFVVYPETALFLVKQNRIVDAEKSIRFFKNIDLNNRELIDDEIDKLKRQIESTSITGRQTKLSDIAKSLTRNPGKKAMIIGVYLAVLNHFSGNFALVSYTANIFEAASGYSALSPNSSALIVAVVQFIGSCMVPVFVERTGRKRLYVLSTVGSTLGLFCLGSFIMLKDWNFDIQSFNWIPVVLLSATVFIQSLAVSTLSFTVTAEILPDNLREFGTSFCNVSLSLSAFLVLKFMPWFWSTIGLHGTMFLFSGFSLASVLFIILYVPESKGKNYEEIMKSLQ